MSGYALLIRDATNNVVFDSRLAAGGVCLGFYTVASGGSDFTFPDFTASTGVALNTNATVPALLYTVDNDLGYLRFRFHALCAGGTYVLFAK